MPHPDWTRLYPAGSRPRIDSLPYHSIPEAVRHYASLWGDKPAFSVCLPNGAGCTLSFNEIDRLSDAFAAYLREDLGLQPGDRVAVQMPNCMDAPIADLGIFKAGLVLVNTNPLYTAPEMNHQFKDSGAKAVVIIDLFGDKLKAALEGTQVKHVILTSLTDFFPPLKRMIINFVLKYVKKQVPACAVPFTRMGDGLGLGKARLAGGLDVKAYANGLDESTVAILQYTGGTTGVSKGAALTHGNILWNMACMYEFGKNGIVDGQETMLTALPLYHVFAFTVNFITFFKAGAHNILVPSPRPISNLKAAFHKFPITWMTGINTLYAALLNEKWFNENPPRHLKIAVAGGAALHQAVAEKWKQLLGIAVYEGYGLSESSPVLTFNPMTEKNKLGTIGVPIQNTEIVLKDDAGNEVAMGEPGELCAKGPQVMKGYWEKPEETAKTIKDGWLHTGDVAVMDELGYFKIVDRKKDMINVSGFKVFPNEVEDALSKLDGVLESAVIGVPSGEAGEAVRAYVVLKPGASSTLR